MLPKLEDFSLFETDLPCKNTLHAELAQWYSLWQVERKSVLRCRRVHILLSHSQLVTGNTAEMRKIVATLLKNSSSHSLRVAVMVQGISSGSLDCQREYHWANSACIVSLHGKSVSKREKSSNFGNIVITDGTNGSPKAALA
jgi:hypothetical protein